MNQIKPNLIVISLRLIFVSILILVGIVIFFDIKDGLSAQNEDALFMIDQRLSSLFFEINIFPRGPGQDVVFLSHLASLKNYVSGSSNYQNVLNDFEAYRKQSEAYLAIDYISLESKETDSRIKVGETIKNYKEIDSLVEAGIRLDDGAVYMSELHQESKGYFSNIHYVTPVFDKEGKKDGIIVLTIDANYFLEDIRNYSKPDEQVYLIDNKGFYLAHPDKTKEFVEGRDGLGSFVNDYPEVGEKILTSKERRIKDGEHVFSLRYIYPTASSFELSDGTSENKDSPYYWILVSVYKQSSIVTTNSGFSGDFLSGHLSMFFLILILVIFGFFVAGYVYKKRKKI